MPRSSGPIGWRCFVRRYLTFMKTVISSKGQIVLPAAIRQRGRVKAGQEFELERLDEGEYLLKRTKCRRNDGLVDLLLACPAKGWFGQAPRHDRRHSRPATRMAYGGCSSLKTADRTRAKAAGVTTPTERTINPA